MEEFTDIELGKLSISQISTYLTDETKPTGSYAVREFEIAEEHSKRLTVYNAKVKSFLSDDGPFFGMQDGSADILWTDRAFWFMQMHCRK